MNEVIDHCKTCRADDFHNVCPRPPFSADLTSGQLKAPSLALSKLLQTTKSLSQPRPSSQPILREPATSIFPLNTLSTRGWN